MRKRSEENKGVKQRVLFLSLVLGGCYLPFIITLFDNKGGDSPIYLFIQRGFTAFPVLAAVISRWLTKDKTPWRINIKVWKRPKLWAFCAFVPSLLIAFGAAIYYLMFPEEYSGSFHYGGLIALTGMPANGSLPINSPILFAAVTVLLSAVFIPIHLLELGEEIGWREYLLPKQIEHYGTHKAVLLNGALWGLAHLPLIYYGFNYSLENPGAPWSNMAMMLLVCVVLGIILSYVMVLSGNVIYSAIIHGAVNIIGEVPVYLSVTQKNGLLGPNPTGLISMSGLIILAIILFFCIGKVEKYSLWD